MAAAAGGGAAARRPTPTCPRLAELAERRRRRSCGRAGRRGVGPPRGPPPAVRARAPAPSSPIPDHHVLVGTARRHRDGLRRRPHRACCADGGRLGVVTDLYTEPGRRELGIGEVMMEALVDWCREQGCFGVDSLALPGDRHTKNFFESFGLVARAIVVHRSLS